jgi:hypothetical protein
MSWDVIVFNLNRKVDSAEEIDETVLVDIGSEKEFKRLIEQNYPDIIWDNDWGKIERKGYSIEFSLGDSDETFSNKLFHLYGENAIYELIEFCKANNWQVFDTGLDQMLDLDKPENNGYKNHQNYLKQILGGK